MKTLTFSSLVALVLLAGCRQKTDVSVSDAQWEQRAQSQMDDYDRQTKRVDEIQEKQFEQNRRFEKLLDKWEEQARRYDAILDAMEKQQGLNK